MTKWGQILGQFTATASGQPAIVAPVTHKVCSKCRQEKPRAEFYPRPGHSPGALLPQCKPCHIETQKERVERNKVNLAALQAKRNAEQPTGAFEWPEDA